MNQPKILHRETSLPKNPNPTEPRAWWVRTFDQIEGITIHHAYGTSTPDAVARYHVSRGRPSIQYHFYIQQDGTITQCLDLKYGVWHDHCGHKNPHIAVCLDGAWVDLAPPVVQLRAAAKLCRWLVEGLGVPKDIGGHHERSVMCNRRSMSNCPGWLVGVRWKDSFYRILEEEFAGEPGAEVEPVSVIKLGDWPQYAALNRIYRLVWLPEKVLTFKEILQIAEEVRNAEG